MIEFIIKEAQTRTLRGMTDPSRPWKWLYIPSVYPLRSSGHGRGPTPTLKTRCPLTSAARVRMAFYPVASEGGGGGMFTLLLSARASWAAARYI